VSARLPLSQYDRDSAVAAQIHELGRYLVGRDAFQIRHFLQIAFDDYAQRRGSLEYDVRRLEMLSRIKPLARQGPGEMMIPPVYPPLSLHREAHSIFAIRCHLRAAD
jgi:hypothetical protein